MYGVIGSTMSAQLNVVVEPSQWLESRPKRPCLEAKNAKEKPTLNKHATSNLAQVRFFYLPLIFSIIVNFDKLYIEISTKTE